MKAYICAWFCEKCHGYMRQKELELPDGSEIPKTTWQECKNGDNRMKVRVVKTEKEARI